MNIVRTQSAPAPVGAYPHARRVGNLLFLSGVGPRLASDNSIPGNVYDTVLEASGARWEDLVDVTVFLTDMDEDFAVYNRIYAEYFDVAQPCRTTLGISALPTPIAIELKCIAAL